MNNEVLQQTPAHWRKGKILHNRKVALCIIPFSERYKRCAKGKKEVIICHCSVSGGNRFHSNHMLLNSAAGNKTLCGSPAIIDQAGLGVHTTSPNLFLRYSFFVQCVLLKVVSMYMSYPQKRNLVFNMRGASSIAIVLAALAAALCLLATAARAQLPAGMEPILSGVLYKD